MTALYAHVQGKDFNTFSTITVTSTDFPNQAQVVFDYRHPQLSFSLLMDGYGSIEYSFNGVTLHGDLVMGMPSQAIFFDNRNVEGVWFRAKTSASINSTVRVEGWSVV